MPTYAYACRDCHHRFEVVQSMNEASLAACPRCDGSLRRVFDPVGVAFRGAGFYRTDSRPKDKE
ncbi:MAG: FmdB family transcriptional regulator [Demequinaceae bacterium]|nr:FmdB family transcriptional regulator [Demequinaceae bacterium]